MEIKNYNIENQADVFAFFLYLMKDLELNFHPDTAFADYVDKEGKPTFTKLQADMLQVMLYACHLRTDSSGQDIYFIAGLAGHFLELYCLTAYVRDDVDISGVVDQIDATYFDNALTPEPYIVNWSLKSAYKRKMLTAATHYRIIPFPHNQFDLTFYNEKGVLGKDGGSAYIYSSVARAYQDLNELIKFGLDVKALPGNIAHETI